MKGELKELVIIDRKELDKWLKLFLERMDDITVEGNFLPKEYIVEEVKELVERLRWVK